MAIGERIAELRKQRNISQVQLAKALEVSRQAVSKWENDLTTPDTLNLIRLADVLDTDTEYLATGWPLRIEITAIRHNGCSKCGSCRGKGRRKAS